MATITPAQKQMLEARLASDNELANSYNKTFTRLSARVLKGEKLSPREQTDLANSKKELAKLEKSIRGIKKRLRV